MPEPKLEGQKLGKWKIVIDKTIKDRAIFDDDDMLIRINPILIAKKKETIYGVLVHEIGHLIDFEATEFKCDLNGKYVKELNKIYGGKK